MVKNAYTTELTTHMQYTDTVPRGVLESILAPYLASSMIPFVPADFLRSTKQEWSKEYAALWRGINTCKNESLRHVECLEYKDAPEAERGREELHRLGVTPPIYVFRNRAGTFEINVDIRERVINSARLESSLKATYTHLLHRVKLFEMLNELHVQYQLMINSGEHYVFVRYNTFDEEMPQEVAVKFRDIVRDCHPNSRCAAIKSGSYLVDDVGVLVWFDESSIVDRLPNYYYGYEEIPTSMTSKL